jgi:hypothetical protein
MINAAPAALQGAFTMPHMTRVSSPRKRTVLRKKRRKLSDQTEGQTAHAALPTNRQALNPETVLQMQQAVGNRSVQHLLEPGQSGEPVLQRKEGDQLRIKAFIEKHGDHAHLLAGFNDAMGEAEIVGQLIENFFQRRDFTYNFTSKAALMHSGDCVTLVREFIQIAREVFGIPMNMKSDKGGFLISGGHRIVHKDDVTGNIDDGKSWYFEEHTWAEWEGKPIDVLFGQLGIVSHQKGVATTYDKNGIPIWDAGGFKFYLKEGAASQFDQYTSDPGARQKEIHW